MNTSKPWRSEVKDGLSSACSRRRLVQRRRRRPAADAPARGETIERSFAHLYDTGGMRRTRLCGYTNILKRLLAHAGAFNLGLSMRQMIGIGTPRGLQGRRVAVIGACLAAMAAFRVRSAARECLRRRIAAVCASLEVPATLVVTPPRILTSATGC